MKHSFYIVFFILVQIESFSQNAYYDAINLADNYLISVPAGGYKFDQSSNVIQMEIAEILARYSEQPLASTDPGKVKLSYDTNPFIKEYYTTGGSLSTSSLTNSYVTGASITPGFNFTTIADGFAKFLVKRTKEELNVAFFRNFKNVFEPYPEFQALFPRTYSFIEMIEEQNYASMIQVLKEAFEEDMLNLVGNVPNLADLNDCPAGNNKCISRKAAIEDFFDSEKGRMVWLSSIFVDNLIKGQNIADALKSIVENNDLMLYNNGLNQSDVLSAVSILELISSSLRSKEGEMIWVDVNDIKSTLISDDNVRNIYFGLLYQQSKVRKIRFDVGDGTYTFFHDVLAELKSEGNNFKSFLNSFMVSMKQMESSIKDIKALREGNSEVNLAFVSNYLSGLNRFFNETQIFVSQFPNSGNYGKIKGKLTTSLKSLDSTMSLSIKVINDIENRNYGSIIFNTVVLLEKALEDPAGTDTDLAKNLKSFQKKFLRYGTFVAIVAQAENSDQVNAAIEAVALPSGSSSIKRKSSFNVSLNAYVGPFGGGERLTAYGKDSIKFVTGITSPIGIALSFGNWDSFINGFTIFASIVDLGAITTYRFDDNNAEDLPELSFENILAPGIHGFLNFRNSPMSLGGGYQLGPSARKINDKSESISRWHLAIVVDIPLINFYTKSR